MSESLFTLLTLTCLTSGRATALVNARGYDTKLDITILYMTFHNQIGHGGTSCNKMLSLNLIAHTKCIIVLLLQGLLTECGTLIPTILRLTCLRNQWLESWSKNLAKTRHYGWPGVIIHLSLRLMEPWVRSNRDSNCFTFVWTFDIVPQGLAGSYKSNLFIQSGSHFYCFSIWLPMWKTDWPTKSLCL